MKILIKDVIESIMLQIEHSTNKYYKKRMSKGGMKEIKKEVSKHIRFLTDQLKEKDVHTES